jgi:hypothetical protein
LEVPQPDKHDGHGRRIQFSEQIAPDTLLDASLQKAGRQMNEHRVGMKGRRGELRISVAGANVNVLSIRSGISLPSLGSRS